MEVKNNPLSKINAVRIKDASERLDDLLNKVSLDKHYREEDPSIDEELMVSAESVTDDLVLFYLAYNHERQRADAWELEARRLGYVNGGQKDEM